MKKNKDQNGIVLSYIDFYIVFIGLTIGNFIYQYFSAQDWLLAGERSIFQLVALFAVWNMGLFHSKTPEDETWAE